MPAMRRYAGTVYAGLDVADAVARRRRLAGRELLIFSGLFGVLRGAEPVPAYRVPAQAVLPGLGVLASFWRRQLTELIGPTARPPRPDRRPALHRLRRDVAAGPGQLAGPAAAERPGAVPAARRQLRGDQLPVEAGQGPARGRAAGTGRRPAARCAARRTCWPAWQALGGADAGCTAPAARRSRPWTCTSDPGGGWDFRFSQYRLMRLDHLSYAAGPEGLASCVQRLGAQLGAGFIDGGLHPRFGTRNFVLPLAGGVYLEVVEALDHPAVETAPVRPRGEGPQAGRRRLAELGGRGHRPGRGRAAAGPAGGRRAPGPPGRLRPALEADRHQRHRRRPAAALVHPLGVGQVRAPGGGRRQGPAGAAGHRR